MTGRQSYKALQTIFNQQCEIVEGKVTVRDKTGGNCMQNPSDPEATYDGHKGPGYQVQITETCGAENEVQLITAALPQTAWNRRGGGGADAGATEKSRPVTAGTARRHALYE